MSVRIYPSDAINARTAAILTEVCNAVLAHLNASTPSTSVLSQGGGIFVSDTNQNDTYSNKPFRAVVTAVTSVVNPTTTEMVNLYSWNADFSESWGSFNKVNDHGNPDAWVDYVGGRSGSIGEVANISAVSNTTPVEVTTSADNNFITGQVVVIAGCAVPALDGTWHVVVTDSTHFTLTNSTASGAGGAAGTATVTAYSPAFEANGNPVTLGTVVQMRRAYFDTVTYNDWMYVFDAVPQGGIIPTPAYFDGDVTIISGTWTWPTSSVAGTPPAGLLVIPYMTVFPTYTSSLGQIVCADKYIAQGSSTGPFTGGWEKYVPVDNTPVYTSITYIDTNNRVAVTNNIVTYTPTTSTFAITGGIFTNKNTGLTSTIVTDTTVTPVTQVYTNTIVTQQNTTTDSFEKTDTSVTPPVKLYTGVVVKITTTTPTTVEETDPNATPPIKTYTGLYEVTKTPGGTTFTTTDPTATPPTKTYIGLFEITKTPGGNTFVETDPTATPPTKTYTGLYEITKTPGGSTIKTVDPTSTPPTITSIGVQEITKTPGGTTVGIIDPTGTYPQIVIGTTALMTNITVGIAQVHTTQIPVSIKQIGSNTVNLFQIVDVSNNLLMAVDKDGYIKTNKITAIADGDLDTSQGALWIDDTPAAAALMVKIKASDNTVQTLTLNGSGGGVSIGDVIGSSTNYYILSIDGSGNLSQINPSTAGYVLTSNGAAAATFQAVTATPAGAQYEIQINNGSGALTTDVWKIQSSVLIGTGGGAISCAANGFTFEACTPSPGWGAYAADSNGNSCQLANGSYGVFANTISAQADYWNNGQQGQTGTDPVGNVIQGGIIITVGSPMSDVGSPSFSTVADAQTWCSSLRSLMQGMGLMA